jgi:hypothetical protein
MDNQDEELEFGRKFANWAARLPVLIDFERRLAQITNEYERLKGDKARMVESYKAIALAEAKQQAEDIIEAAKAEGRRELANSQAENDKIEAENRHKRKIGEELDAQNERKQRLLAENDARLDRIRHALAS